MSERKNRVHKARPHDAGARRGSGPAFGAAPKAAQKAAPDEAEAAGDAMDLASKALADKRVRVVPMGKYRLVANVLWSGVVSEFGTLYSRAELARAARARGHDALVLARLRAGSLPVPHFGQRGLFGANARRNCLSLAVLLTGVLSRGVLVLRLKDQDNVPFWWVWAARSGVVSSLADSCHANLDEARELAAAIGKSLGVGVPRVLEEADSLILVERAFAKASRDIRREAALLPLEPLSTGRLVAAGTIIVLFAGLLVGGKTLVQTWEARARNAILFETKAELERKAAHVRSHPEAYFDISWQKRLEAGRAAAILLPAMLEHPMAGNGWQLVHLSANGKTLAARWKALPAASLLVLPEGAQTDAKNPEEALRSSPLSLPESDTALAKEDLLARDDVGVRLAEIARRLGTGVKLSFKKPESLVVGETRVEAPWVEGTAQLRHVPDFAVSDWTALAGALEMPGLFVKTISWDGRHWGMALDVVARK